MPERIQQKRTPGWRMPPNSKSVTRPGKWGNPYDWREYGCEQAIEKYREGILGKDLSSELGRKLARLGKDLSELRGKNLACFCPLNQRCHADVLLELANR
jgi:hypothetical protein